MRREAETGAGSPTSISSPAPRLWTQAEAKPKPLIHVACGALVNQNGEALLAQRPEGKIAAGYWEFPGGKIESGESARAALSRELHEELGVEITSARPLIRFTHHYSNRSIVLDTWLVSGWNGEPQGREAQALQWLKPQQFAAASPLLPTVAPIACALGLPLQYVFTPAEATLDFLLAKLPALPPGALLRLRQPALSPSAWESMARRLLAACRGLGLRLLLDGDPARALALGADGWHASSTELAALDRRPDLPLCIASVHAAAELQRAALLGFDAAVLGTVMPSASHPGAATLGWAEFSRIAASAGLPVYAIGGLSPNDLDTAFAAYAQGIAGISAFW